MSMLKINSKKRTGILLSFLAAILSGFAVYFNKSAFLYFSNSDLLTTIKNSVVAFLCISLIMIFAQRNILKKINRKDWLLLVLVGFLGGGCAFLLFFKGLSLAQSSLGPALIHKTLFIWVSIMAVVFLKEKINKFQAIALIVLLASCVYLIGLPQKFSFGIGEILVLLATLIWAAENVLAKYLLNNRLSSEIVITSRMFFGSLALLIYVLATGQFSALNVVPSTGWIWAFAVSLMLFGYVVFWYNALKYAPVSLLSSVLVLAVPITIFLDFIFGDKTPTKENVVASILIFIAITAIMWLSNNERHTWIHSKQQMRA